MKLLFCHKYTHTTGAHVIAEGSNNLLIEKWRTISSNQGVTSHIAAIGRLWNGRVPGERRFYRTASNEPLELISLNQCNGEISIIQYFANGVG